MAAHKFNCNNLKALTTTAAANNKNISQAMPPSSSASVKGMQQQQQQQHGHHLPRLQLPQIVAVATVIFGLLFSSCICVSGQIDGYTAGVDYPTYDSVPKGLSFKCQGRTPGYYADTETRCQATPQFAERLHEVCCRYDNM
uniref:Uncharacterized protein n=1 Tax=Stomoxys calcitrans TaxID=35570 RepID=A0A1I8Q735_STOCA